VVIFRVDLSHNQRSVKIFFDYHRNLSHTFTLGYVMIKEYVNSWCPWGLDIRLIFVWYLAVGFGQNVFSLIFHDFSLWPRFTDIWLVSRFNQQIFYSILLISIRYIQLKFGQFYIEIRLLYLWYPVYRSPSRCYSLVLMRVCTVHTFAWYNCISRKLRLIFGSYFNRRRPRHRRNALNFIQILPCKPTLSGDGNEWWLNRHKLTPSRV